VTRRVVVHSLDHARAAVTAAAALGVPVMLASAPAAGGYAGPAWFKALVEAACAACPEAEVSALLDCGEEAGTVLAALRLGLKRLRFTGPAATRERLAGLAAALDAAIEGDAPDGALDLLAQRDPAAACRVHLMGGGTSG
jgi:hypothetical protein